MGPPADPEGARVVLRRAQELGVNLIDTADSYGPYVSEELIAEALYPYEGLTVATKGGLERTGPGKWPRNGHPDHLKQACEGSLKRLRVERIDLYQLHSPDDKGPYEESVGAMKQLCDDAEPGGVAAAIAETHDVSTGQVALAWLLRRSPVIVPIPGTSSVQHLEENVAPTGVELSDQEFEQLNSASA